MNSSSLSAVGAERRLARWFAGYFVALLALVLLALGDLVWALLLVAGAEAVFLMLRPQPNFDAATFRPPAPERWQGPIATLRWVGLANSVWMMVSAAIGATVVTSIVLVFLGVVIWHRGLGWANLAVLLLFAAWIATRPLWIGRLRTALRVRTANQIARFVPTIRVGVDGVDIDLRPAVIGAAPARSFRVSVGFAELEEVRLMDGLTAQGYLGAMGQHDPTLAARMEWELIRFMTNPAARPSILVMWSVGTHILLRGATVWYLVGNADQTGPPTVAAWDAWRAAHGVPSGAGT